MLSPGDRGEQRAAAQAHLVAALDLTGVSRLCPRCASTSHGQPRALRPASASTEPLHLSLSYAVGLTVLAWSSVPVGIDVELEGPDVDGVGDRRSWTRSEALLKVTGEGLSRDPGDLPVLWSAPLTLPRAWLGTVACAAAPDDDVRLVASDSG